MHTFSPPGPAPDLSYYAQQLADQMGGSDKGPTFDPNQFQYMQASVGPVGQRGPQGKSWQWAVANLCREIYFQVQAVNLDRKVSKESEVNLASL